MDFTNKLSSILPFLKKEEKKEYFFALNIGQQTLDAALWELSGKHLQIIKTATAEYSSLEEITRVTDTLLDNVVGNLEIEPQKILFGVLDSWLAEDDLKEEYLKLLRNLVKELELTPMAYVATSQAILHFLENKEGVPATAILVGFEKDYLMITVSRAGKLDGSKIIKRSEDAGVDIEKALLTFSNVETLPSKILIYGKGEEKLKKLKAELLSFSWMSKLSFLHFPKIDFLTEGLEINSICLAGAKEINPDTIFQNPHIPAALEENNPDNKISPADTEEKNVEKAKDEATGFGFVVGDISQKGPGEELGEEKLSDEEKPAGLDSEQTEEGMAMEIASRQDMQLGSDASGLEVDDFEQEDVQMKPKSKLPILGALAIFKKFPKLNFRSMPLLIAGVVVIGLVIAYLFLPKASVKIFVEPQILEKDTQVTADPKVKTVDEDAKIIPGQVVETQVSGSGKGDVTGKKEIGDPAKGTVKIINNSPQDQSLSKGTSISSGGIKFTFDSTVNIASTSATADSKSTATASVTASAVGADGNLASGTQFTSPNSQLAIVAQGNFSGGNSKSVTVVSDSDQQKLLAQVAGDLRKQAQQKLQDTLKDKKILAEGLSEQILTKKFNKNINDQASELSLDLTVKYTGTAYDDKDLKLIVSKLVDTDVPAGFKLSLDDTETQADVSKLENDGRLIFLARFKAKLIPQLDLDKIKNQIKGKTPKQVSDILKSQEHILGSEIIINPTLPSFLQRLPIWGKNINLEVGLK